MSNNSNKKINNYDDDDDDDDNKNVRNYEHIKALVRDLHMTKNVPRPISNTTQSISSTNSSNVQLVKNGLESKHKLVHQLELRTSSDGEEDESYTDEGDTHNNNGLLFNSWKPTNHKLPVAVFQHRRQNDVHLEIPSLIITDVNGPQDLLTSTQRRFSQLYSGLRRLSTSHTVGLQIVMEINQIKL